MLLTLDVLVRGACVLYGITTKERGWGLGLSLAKRIIEEYHNGEIKVEESSIGQGTKMMIKLKGIE